MAELKVQWRREQDGTVVAQVIGEAGVQETETLERELGTLAASKAPRIILDLSNLKFLSSIAIGSLVTFRRSLERGGGKVELAGMQPMVLTAFKRTRVDELFTIHPTVEMALKAKPGGKTGK